MTKTRVKISQTVAQDMLSKIKTGEWPAHMRLASEASLAETYLVSRNTIREAIQLLEDGGYLKRNFSAGTFVLPIKMKYSMENLISIGGLIRSNGFECERCNIEVDIIKPTTLLQQKLAVSALDPIYRVSRTYKGNGIPMVHDYIYSSQKYFEGIDEKMLNEHSMTEIREMLGRQVLYSECDIKSVLPPKEVANALSIKNTQPLLLMQSVMYGLDGGIVSYVEDYFTDFFDFTLRRVKKTL